MECVFSARAKQFVTNHSSSNILKSPSSLSNCNKSVVKKNFGLFRRLVVASLTGCGLEFGLDPAQLINKKNRENHVYNLEWVAAISLDRFITSVAGGI